MPHCRRDHQDREQYRQVYRPAEAYWPIFSGQYGWGGIYRGRQTYYQNWQNPSFWGRQPLVYNPECGCNWN